MERLDDNDRLLLLERANERFDRFFARFSGAPVLGSNEEVEALLTIEDTLRSIGALLDGRLQDSQSPAVHEALAGYRQNLIRLRRELAVMQTAALACRTRLASRQEHLRAARAWCTASRATT